MNKDTGQKDYYTINGWRNPEDQRIDLIQEIQQEEREDDFRKENVELSAFEKIKRNLIPGYAIFEGIEIGKSKILGRRPKVVKNFMEKKGNQKIKRR